MARAARASLLIGAAAVLKMTCGTDDLVWLAPFMAREKTRAGKARVALLYIASVCFLVSIAAAFGAATSAAAASGTSSAQDWLKGVAGGLLILYSVYLAYQDGWLAACGLGGPEDAESDRDEQQGSELCSNLLGERTSAEGAGEPKRNNIVIVALLGSLDDFTVYLIMAGSGVYSWYELILGTALGCLALASIVVLLTESAVLSAALERVPAWLILFALGAYVLSDLA